MVRRRHLPRDLLQEVEPPPDGKVEEGEHDEGQKAGQAHLKMRNLIYFWPNLLHSLNVLFTQVQVE